MKKLVISFFILSALNSFVYASFPVTESIEEAPISEIAESAVYADSGWPGIVALSCAVLSILLPIILDYGLTFWGLILALLLFVSAIVFGAIGFNRSLKGLGIAGFVLGILGVIGATHFLAEGDYYDNRYR